VEEVKELLKALRDAELKRVLSLVYALWIPFAALSAYLLLLTKSLASLWILMIGVIPYIIVLRKASRLERLFKKEYNIKRFYIIAIALALVLSTTLGTFSPPLGAAGGIAGWLISVAIIMRKEGLLDACAGLGALLLVTIAYLEGLNQLEQWLAFIISIIFCYSTVAIVRALDAFYEVLPHVGENRER